VKKNYKRKERKSNHNFAVVRGQELLLRVPLPMAEVWAEMQPQIVSAPLGLMHRAAKSPSGVISLMRFRHFFRFGHYVMPHFASTFPQNLIKPCCHRELSLSATTRMTISTASCAASKFVRLRQSVLDFNLVRGREICAVPPFMRQVQ